MAMQAGGTVPRSAVRVTEGNLAIAGVPHAAAFQPRSSQFWRRLLETRLVGTGLAITAVVVLCALAAPLIAPYDPNEQDYLALTEAPSPPIRSVPTISVATSCHASSTARACRSR